MEFMGFGRSLYRSRPGSPGAEVEVEAEVGL